MRTEEMLALVKKATHVSELHHVTTFKGSRKDKGGVLRDLTIEVLDAGTEEPDRRYRVTAIDSGAASSLDSALEAVRWADLDAPMQAH
jgi:hypothetical protein